MPNYKKKRLPLCSSRLKLQKFFVLQMISAKNLQNIKKITCYPPFTRVVSIVINPTVSVAEIMLIMILFHSGGYRCFKHFYLEYVCKHLAHLFPRKVSYNRFVELEKEVLFPLAIFIKTVLIGRCTGISFVDSTPLCVCRNQRIHIHKSFEGLATRGKCSMGWFFGFKLHLKVVCRQGVYRPILVRYSVCGRHSIVH